MKKVMLVGPVGAGKTSLIQAMQQTNKKAEKTVSILFSDGAIDTPGEYAQIPRFYSALMVTATQADAVVIVQDAGDPKIAMPPGFAGMFARPVVGVVTKVDKEGIDKEKSEQILLQTGVRKPIFFVSAHTGEGLNELREYLESL